MSTTLYLRNTTTVVPAHTGSKSVALPGVGSLVNSTDTSTKSLGTSKGAAVDKTINTLAQTARQDGFFNSFLCLQPLDAQTIAAQTWTFAAPMAENNGAANAFLAFSFYVYRPTTGAVVGFIYDSASPLGNEWATPSFLGRLTTFAGAQVVAAKGDYLVLEVWADCVQSNATTRALTMRIGQSGVDASEGSAATTAAFIQSTNDLSLGTQTTVSTAQSTGAVLDTSQQVGNPTRVRVSLKTSGGALTAGGEAAGLLVAVTGANSATPAVVDNSDGTYDVVYTPTAAGSDSIAVAFNGVALSNSPLTSVVRVRPGRPRPRRNTGRV